MSSFLLIFVYAVYSQECSIGIEMFDSIPGDPDNNPLGWSYRVSMIEEAKNDGAVCLDGSTPDFYYRPGFDDGVTKFNINIAAGGWCVGINDSVVSPNSKIDTCYHRTTINGGTSNFHKEYARIFGEWHDINSTKNPVFHNWNEVSLNYCDGGSFTGNNETVYNDTENGIVLYFRGNRILKAFFKHLWEKYDMKSATDINVGGCSAGGLSTYLHLNWIYDTYIRPNPHIRFTAIFDSGFFLEYEGIGKFITGMQWLYQWGNVTADSINPRCIEKYSDNKDDLYLCMFAQNNVDTLYPEIKMLSYQSRFDLWQLQNELMNITNESANAYGANLTYYYLNNYVNANNSKLHTAFLDSCYHHCGQWQHIYIDGLMQTQVMVDWYYGNQTQQLYFQNETYPCDQCCVPPSY